MRTSERLRLKNADAGDKSTNVRKTTSPGAVIVLNSVPANNTDVFYQFRALAPSMTLSNGVLSNDNAVIQPVQPTSGGGELLPVNRNHTQVAFMGTPGRYAWRIIQGDMILIRDSKPTKGSEVTKLLGSMFNSDFQAIHIGLCTANEIRHGDILVLNNEGVRFRDVSQAGLQSGPLGYRVLTFVEDHPNTVGYAVQSRDAMAHFRGGIERFMGNLSFTPEDKLQLDAKKNDTELKKLRASTFIMILHKRTQFPADFKPEVILNIISHL